jgi:flagellar hook-associated protein 1 FlgK
LAAYQAALAVSGQNIANVGNPEYARQSGRLSAQPGGPVFGVSPGGGVRLTALRRHVDEALESRLRLARGERGAGGVMYQTLSQTEALYNELTERDVSTQLQRLFGNFAQLEAAPRDSSARNIVVASADDLVRSIQRQRSGLLQQVGDLNERTEAGVQHVNSMLKQIADLNVRIAAQESDGAVAGALRDRRDALLGELSDQVDVRVREQANGAVNLYLGSDPLLEFNRARQLQVVTENVDGLERAVPRFADDHGRVILTGGALAGVLEARDQHLHDQLHRLDRLARGLIWEVNRLHADGVGTVGYTSLTSNYAALDPNAALDDAGLPFPVRNGTFLVKVRDTQTGAITTRQIAVDLDGIGDDTTLTTLAASLDGVPGLRAEVTPDFRLSISAVDGQEFWFNEDESRVLAGLGLASFFSGTDAKSIQVDPRIRADVRRVATSLTGALNDGAVAGRIALLADPTRISELLDNQSLSDFHAATIGGLAVNASAALVAQEAADAVYSGLYAQREALSGVSLDEEAINLTKFERAYQGAVRYIGVLDTLTSELLTIVR